MAKRPKQADILEALGDYISETADAVRELADGLRGHAPPDVQIIIGDIEQRLGQASRDYDSVARPR